MSNNILTWPEFCFIFVIRAAEPNCSLKQTVDLFLDARFHDVSNRNIWW